jgi:hypothetical protein
MLLIQVVFTKVYQETANKGAVVRICPRGKTQSIMFSNVSASGH